MIWLSLPLESKINTTCSSSPVWNISSSFEGMMPVTGWKSQSMETNEPWLVVQVSSHGLWTSFCFKSHTAAAAGLDLLKYLQDGDILYNIYWHSWLWF